MTFISVTCIMLVTMQILMSAASTRVPATSYALTLKEAMSASVVMVSALMLIRKHALVQVDSLSVV